MSCSDFNLKIRCNKIFVLLTCTDIPYIYHCMYSDAGDRTRCREDGEVEGVKVHTPEV